MSFALPSPGHQLTIPGGGGTQTCAPAAGTNVSPTRADRRMCLTSIGHLDLLLLDETGRNESLVRADVVAFAPIFGDEQIPVAFGGEECGYGFQCSWIPACTC